MCCREEGLELSPDILTDMQTDRRTDRKKGDMQAGCTHTCHAPFKRLSNGNTLRQARQEGTDKFGWMTAMPTERQLWSCNERERENRTERNEGKERWKYIKGCFRTLPVFYVF